MYRSYYFFLPDGGVLGGVETWVYNLVSHLNLNNEGRAYIVSLNISRNRVPMELSSCTLEIPYDVSTEESKQLSMLNAVSLLKSFVKPHSVLIPNYSEHSYSIAAGVRNNNFGNCEIWAILHSDEPHYYDVSVFYSSFISRFVCVSSEIEKKLKKMLPNRIDSTSTRACGVIVDEIDEQDIVNKHLNDSKLNITYVGRIIDYQKRIFDLVNFLKLLEKEDLSYVVNVIGVGKDLQELKKQLSYFIDSKKLIFHGRLQSIDVKKILKSSQIYVSFSSFEGTSLALIESLNYGCIPIVTKVSGVSDLLSGPSENNVYQVGEVSQAVALVKRIMKLSIEEKKEMVKFNYGRARNYSIPKYADWFLDLKPSLVSGEATSIQLSESWKEWRQTRRFRPFITFSRKVYWIANNSFFLRFARTLKSHGKAIKFRIQTFL